MILLLQYYNVDWPK